ncbi:RNA-directed DNA polymerase [Gregarina niphandrodes]|uniref:RNA-directed DNA polymerase n=1 Tax=Gregarina niphandrodes TaxID=110365 RepID=A0A023AWS7_GRENI|nr:RNA-directed DNA polymerase [Gregarina niphandrodes]EZG43032.1 RNA-directed DNA polymerase [Gregarina niphandrodes]|eukprot:XP_011133695.1 RNA-directed DNA polymerase [Gregarina niphandrodes]
MLDMNSGFWNVPIEKGCKHLTAFITPIVLFEFNIVPFGIKNSPARFQRAMDTCFAPTPSDDVFCYIDDVIMCGNDPREILEQLRTFLGLCRGTGFYLRLDKSAVATN